MSENCNLCKYVCFDVHGKGNSYYCTNQDSPMFGEKTGSGCNEYDRFEPRPSMSFKDALETLVMLPHGAYPDYFFLFGKKGETSRPFFCISFKDNKQMYEYREALARCFDELMKLKEEAGDFEEAKKNADGA